MQVPAGTLLLVACCLWTAEGQGEPPRKSIWEDPIQFNTKTKDACTMIVTGQGDLTKLRVACKNQGKEYWCEYAGKPQVCRSYNNNPRHYFTQIMWDLRKLPNACQGARVIKPQMCKRASDEAQMVFQTSWPRLFTPRPVRPTQGRQPAQARPEQPKPEAPRAEVPSPEEPKPEEARPEESRPQVPRPEESRPQESRPEQSRPEVPRPDYPRQSRPPQPKPQPVKPDASRPLGKVVPFQRATPKPTKTTPDKSAQPATKAEAKRLAQEYCWRSLQGICAYIIGWFTK